MSYCRFASDSDAYIFFNSGGFFECQLCLLLPRDADFRNTGFLHGFGTFMSQCPEKMIEHVKEHRAAGHKIPDGVEEALAKDVNKHSIVAKAAAMGDK